MRILILTHFFPPEIGAAAVRMSDLASGLRASGDDVTVVTGMPNYPTGRIPDAYRHGRRRSELMAGVHVRRAWIHPASTAGRFRRILNHLSFAISSVPLALRCGRPDVIVVNSPPIFLALSAIVLGGVWR